MSPCESLTTISFAPPSIAPRIAALTSSVISRRNRAYSGSRRSTCSQSVTPAVPSMSAEIKTFMDSPLDAVDDLDARDYAPSARIPSPTQTPA